MNVTSRTIWRRVAPLVLAVLAVPRVSGQQPPALADVAKQEEQRRKAVTQPSKVYTNKDVKPDTFSGRVAPSIPSPAIEEGPGTQAVQQPQASADDASGNIQRIEGARRAFMRATGFSNGRPGWVIDHVIPLACGGADDLTNMRWQTEAEAREKDKIERIGCLAGQAATTDVIPTWQVPIITTPIVLPPSCGTNTVREQAMADYIRAAGFGGSTAPLPPCPH